MPDVADERVVVDDLGVEAVARAEQRQGRICDRQLLIGGGDERERLVARVDNGARCEGRPPAPLCARDRRAGRSVPGRAGTVSVGGRRAPARPPRGVGRPAPQCMGRASKIGPGAHVVRRCNPDNQMALDDRRPAVLIEIRLLLDLPADAKLPPRAWLEHTLTSGYASVLSSSSSGSGWSAACAPCFARPMGRSRARCLR